MSSIIYESRLFLIRTGKVLPFVICFIVAVSYLEDITSMLSDNYVIWNECLIPSKPITWFVCMFFEYNLQTVLILIVVSFAINTCIYNKLACAYLLLNLAEKSFFDFELEPAVIYIICLANVFVAGYLTIKGITVLTKTK